MVKCHTMLGSVLTRGRSHLNIHCMDSAAELYTITNLLIRGLRTKLNQEFHILQALCHPVGVPLFHAI